MARRFVDFAVRWSTQTFVGWSTVLAAKMMKCVACQAGARWALRQVVSGRVAEPLSDLQVGNFNWAQPVLDSHDKGTTVIDLASKVTVGQKWKTALRVGTAGIVSAAVVRTLLRECWCRFFRRPVAVMTDPEACVRDRLFEQRLASENVRWVAQHGEAACSAYPVRGRVLAGSGTITETALMKAPVAHDRTPPLERPTSTAELQVHKRWCDCVFSSVLDTRLRCNAPRSNLSLSIYADTMQQGLFATQQQVSEQTFTRQEDSQTIGEACNRDCAMNE